MARQTDDGTRSATRALDPGESCSFTITEFIDGDFGTDHSNTVTVVLTDDDNNTDEGTDTETVERHRRAPEVVLMKDVSPASLASPAASSRYAVTVTNIALRRSPSGPSSSTIRCRPSAPVSSVTLAPGESAPRAPTPRPTPTWDLPEHRLGDGRRTTRRTLPPTPTPRPSPSPTCCRRSTWSRTPPRPPWPSPAASSRTP